MSQILPTITFAVFITIPVLPIITIITYYFVFETGQLADESRQPPATGKSDGWHHCGNFQSLRENPRDFPVSFGKWYHFRNFPETGWWWCRGITWKSHGWHHPRNFQSLRGNPMGDITVGISLRLVGGDAEVLRHYYVIITNGITTNSLLHNFAICDNDVITT